MAVEDRLFQALAWLRWVVLANTVALNVYRYDNFDRPVLGLGVVAALVVWTVLAGHFYADHARRGWALLGTDLGIAVVALVSSPRVQPRPGPLTYISNRRSDAVAHILSTMVALASLFPLLSSK